MQLLQQGAAERDEARTHLSSTRSAWARRRRPDGVPGCDRYSLRQNAKLFRVLERAPLRELDDGTRDRGCGIDPAAHTQAQRIVRLEHICRVWYICTRRGRGKRRCASRWSTTSTTMEESLAPSKTSWVAARCALRE
jgi:hypothetical protein